jgi:Ca2+-binding EF-hand superfamily protein
MPFAVLCDILRVFLTSVRIFASMYVLQSPAAVEDEPQIRTMAVPPMMKLKDKLYQKNEKLYKSFGLFDIDKIGSVTTQQFADTVDRLNVSFVAASPSKIPSMCFFSCLCTYLWHFDEEPCVDRSVKGNSQ